MRTVSQLQAVLGTYVVPQGSFIVALNQVLEKLYSLGEWNDLKVQVTMDAAAGYIVLAPDYECLLAGRLNNVPIVIQGMYYQYQENGPGFLDPPVGQVYGLMDEGRVSLMSDLPTDGLTELVFTLTSGTFASGDSVTVNYTTEDGLVTASNSPTSGTTFTLTPASNILSIESISYASLPGRVLAQAEDSSSNNITYAILLPGDNTAQFRRYQVPQVSSETSQTWTLDAVVKRAFMPVSSASDMVRLDNVEALKHGLLAVIAEDASDLARSELHWAKAEKALSNVLNQSRGGAKSYPQVNPWGNGIGAIPNRY